uniref:Uncharacterized protein n=1 Tax=Anguilla anguilla TaxID=7936 RepID=A0A0E9PS65_ANGAN
MLPIFKAGLPVRDVKECKMTSCH